MKYCDIFVHVPKAAGTTVHGILEQNYSPWRQFSFRAPRQRALEKFEGLSSVARSRLELIKGHCGYGLHDSVSSPVRYFTMLRDPVKRVVSEYYYIRRNSKPSFHKLLNEQKIGLGDYVERNIGTDNLHLRFLTFRELESAPAGPAKEEWLEVACKRLKEDFAFVGIVEKFDESMLLLQQSLNLKSVNYLKSNARPGGGVKEDSSILALIEKQERLDIKLYNFAQKLFEENWANFEERYPHALADYRRENAINVKLRRTFRFLNYTYCRTVWKVNGIW